MRRIASFLAVGACGFAVDFVSLWAALGQLQWTPIPARLLAFATALLFTYALNRFITFSDRDASGRRKFGLYALASAVAGSANIGVYAAMLQVLPPGSLAPYIAMPVGTAVGLIANFLLYNFVVFCAAR